MIPSKPLHITGKEHAYIAEAIASQKLCGDGPFTRRCERWIENYLGSPRCLLTVSCTAALEMAAHLAGIERGDEVIMPSFTFTSTATAFVLKGAVPVFVDINPLDCNISPAAIESAITPKTRAIVPVHYAGNSCDMKGIVDIAKSNNLIVIEDAAQALCATYKGKRLGTFGTFGCISFHESKNVHCGEGGVLLINDENFIQRAEILREKGTNRAAFFRSEVDKYTWVDIGSSYLPSELNAAFLLAQLEEALNITQKRMNICKLYLKLLEPLEQRGCIKLPSFDSCNSGSAHIFYIMTSSLKERSALSAWLKSHNILVFFHYVPLHSSPAGKRFGRVSEQLIHTEFVADRLLRLPLYVDMQIDEVEKVAEKITAFYNK